MAREDIEKRLQVKQRELNRLVSNGLFLDHETVKPIVDEINFLRFELERERNEQKGND